LPTSALRDNADQLCARYRQSQAEWIGMLTQFS